MRQRADLFLAGRRAPVLAAAGFFSLALLMFRKASIKLMIRGPGQRQFQIALPVYTLGHDHTPYAHRPAGRFPAKL